MAQLLIAAAGSAIGAQFGYAAVGWAVGSMLGASLADPIRQEGARLSDLRVSSASEGRSIPIVYGTARFAGNVIWAAPIREVGHTEEVGGKGGPSVEQTTYSYYASFAVGLCAGEIVGVRRIWANGKLIYDASDTADAQTVIASNANADSITLYTGSETQDPDSTIESYEGAGEVPAHRGLAYLVFDDLALADFGNRLPNVEVEIVAGGTPSGVRRLHAVTTELYLNEATDWVRYENGLFILNVNPSDPRPFWGAGSGAVDYRYNSNGEYIGSESNPHTVGERSHYLGPLGNYLVAAGEGSSSPSTATVHINVYGAGAMVRQFEAGDDGETGSTLGAAVTPDGQNLFLFRRDTAGNYYQRYNSELSYVESGALPSGWAPFINGHSVAAAVESDLSRIWVAGGGSSDVEVYARDDSGDYSISLGSAERASGTNEVALIAEHGVCWVCYRQALDVFAAVSAFTAATADLDDVVSDLCQRGNLAASDIDVTGLTKTVRGYAANADRVGTVRGALEPLQRAFWFDAVESGDAIKFIERGGSSVATLADDDLAAHEYGSQRPDPLISTRAQELDLPRQVRVQFFNASNNHQVGQQYAARLITEARNDVDAQLPVVMTEAEGAQAADVLLYDAWSGRTTYRVSVGPKWSRLEPGDVVTIGGSRMRLTSVDYRFPGLMDLSLVADGDADYSPQVGGVESQGTAQTVGLPGPTALFLLDAPLLRDQDDSDGYYVAAAGYLSAWPGCVLYKSADDGASWGNTGAITTGVVFGSATDALAAPAKPWTWDRANTVNIQLAGGSLSSVSELAVLNGSNAALLQSGDGWELIQFATATLEGDGTYTLDTLLRGRRGTEWANGDHAIGDRFIVLSTAGVRRIDNDLSLERLFRAPAIGATLQGADEQAFTNSGIGKKPYAPVQLAGSRSGSDLTITWQRRTRIGGEWRDYVDASLGEDDEEYDVEVYSDSGYTTLADSVTDHTSKSYISTGAPDPAYVRVYQKSATVGRGYVLQGQL